VIRIGRALGMEVLAYDAYPQAILAEVLDFRYVDMRELLAQSHVVSLHAPATPDTFHMIDADALGQLRPGR
jgi:D-lactate dehydrogenase